MKKSKLDLLSRSFNPSKCKTSLRLAGSRLKLLRNKKEVQMKQMNREIAQLLESGQDQTARIRVEHVIREEKMMAAYDLLEIYCELVVARLPIIESQKTCPIDLKEAIASLVFAAPRCGDVPEFLDVRKQIAAKYGKEFTTAAIELRPQCGVGRMLIEKLSATAPDGQTKLKSLTAIAEGHNVKWDPKSFGDKDYASQNDLLGGPSSFTKESEKYTKPPHFEAAQVQSRPNNSNFSSQDDTASVGPEKLVSAKTPGLSTPFQSESRPEALRNERGQEYRNTSSSMDRSRWNMEFKDATSAAQAAAESAERASMAARAAAELSSYGRISSQYSKEESHKSNVEILRDEGHDAHSNSKLLSEHTGIRNEKVHVIKSNDPKMDKTLKEDGAGSSQGYYSQSASLKPKPSADDSGEASDHGTKGVDEYYSQKSSVKDVSDEKMPADKQSFKYENESANNSWPEKADDVEEGRIWKEQSIKSSFSQSSMSEDVNIFSNSEYPKFENDAGEAPQTSSGASAALFIEKSDSDIDEDHSLFDKGPTYDDQELDFHLSPSFDYKSPEADIDSWIPGSSSPSKIANSASSLFFSREKSPSPDHSENLAFRDDSAPLAFDESEGSISEEEKNAKVDDSKDLLHNEISVFDSQNLPFSDDDEFGSSMETSSKRNQVSIFDDESSPDNNEGMLNFGKLTGGLRHKGRNHLPFLKNRLDESSSSSIKKEAEENIDTISTPTNMIYHKKIQTTQEDMQSESDSDFSDEKVSLPKNSGRKKALTPVRDVITSKDSFFASDNSDLDEDSPKELLTRRNHVRGSGISRRTKVSPSSMVVSPSDSSGIYGKPTNSSNSETPSNRMNSSKWQNYEKPTSTPSANASKPIKSSLSGKASSTTMQESKISQMSSVVEEPKSKGKASIGSENASSNMDERPKNPPTHVHPKLPDYDTLFQSLRTNRS